ncbi:MAG: AAA family ATPase [Bryobacterales bacterium]|nr:AAA family ATPase [Bryobacterales bacterium]
MSGLAATETRLDQGAIDVRIGEGRTAEVLRNLCHLVHTANPSGHWNSVVGWIRGLFGCDLEEPEYVPSRGEVLLFYREGGSRFDISSAGRGMHQTLLLLAYMYANPSSVILLDEPDAHLEILRQRQTYRILTDVASRQGSQIIAASHSEVLLDEAARRDMVVAFVGVPHRIDQSSSSGVRKALGEIGFDDYVQAQQTGWVLYLEGSTDLAILQSFAKRLGHKEALLALERPFVRYVGNQPRSVERHFYGLREAVPDLRGLALFDRLDRDLPDRDRLILLQWRRREIENYLCNLPTLLRFARATARTESQGPLFVEIEIQERLKAMETAVRTVTSALEALGRKSSWSEDVKASDDVLAPVFQNYYRALGLPNLMAKKSFYELAEHLPESEIAEEVRKKLDAIARVATSVAA